VKEQETMCCRIKSKWAERGGKVRKGGKARGFMTATEEYHAVPKEEHRMGGTGRFLTEAGEKKTRKKREKMNGERKGNEPYPTSSRLGSTEEQEEKMQKKSNPAAGGLH